LPTSFNLVSSTYFIFFSAASYFLREASFALVDNKKIKASPAHDAPQTVSVNNAGNTSGDKLPQKETSVKRQYSLADSAGKQLTREQQEYFKNSKMRDENGNLKVMYHAIPYTGLSHLTVIL